MLQETDVDELPQLTVNNDDTTAHTTSNNEVMMGRLDDFKFMG